MYVNMSFKTLYSAPPVGCYFVDWPVPAPGR